MFDELSAQKPPGLESALSFNEISSNIFTFTFISGSRRQVGAANLMDVSGGISRVILGL